MGKRHVIAAFFAGYTLAGLAACVVLKAIEKDIEKKTYYSVKVNDFTTLLLNVIEEERPELLADPRITAFIEEYNFNEIVRNSFSPDSS